MGLLLWIGYWVVWALNATSNPTHDYAAEMTELSRAAQGEGENGWPHLLAAVAAMGAVETQFDPMSRPAAHQERIDYLVHTNSDPKPTDEAIAFARDALARFAASGGLEALDAAAACPNAVRPLQTPPQGLLGVLLPEISQFRHLAQARAAGFDAALEAGDGAAARDAIEHMLVIAHACRHQPTLIESLVGMAIEQMAFQRIRTALFEHELDDHALASIAELLDEYEMGTATIGLEGERRMLLDTSQRIHTDDGNGNGRVVLSELGAIAQLAGGTPTGTPGAPKIVNVFGILMVDRATFEGRINQVFDRMVAQIERGATGDVGQFNLDWEIASMGWRYHVLNTLLPALTKIGRQQRMTEMEFAAVRIMVAIERAGAVPDSLDALAPEFLDLVPLDPFNGKPFGYAVLEDGGYVLYSYGADGRDDGGVGAPAGMAQRALDGLGLPEDYILSRIEDE